MACFQSRMGIVHFFAIWHYSDGTAKEWAIYVVADNQEIEVRFGKAGQ